MSRFPPPAWMGLITAVVVHLIVSMVHGTAHTQAHVPLSWASNVFVIVVILVGPLVGLATAWVAPRIGAWIIAITMAGSLVFGVVNHFVLDSPDHVMQVDPAWRTLFAVTAILLSVTEALGSGLALRVVRSRRFP